MKVMIVMACALTLAACGQTTSSARRAPAPSEPAVAAAPKASAQPRTAAKSAAPQSVADRCTDAANKAVQAQTNAAMLGGALSMVGGMGGFGGRGGMVAAQAASVGGQVVQSQARAQGQASMQECM